MGGKPRAAVLHMFNLDDGFHLVTGCGMRPKSVFDVTLDARRVTCRRCLRGMRSKGLRIE